RASVVPVVRVIVVRGRSVQTLFRQARVSVVRVGPCKRCFRVGPCKRSAAGQIAKAHALPAVRTSSGAEIKWFSDCAGFRRVAADA
ncbi:TPA: hypothetical protein ACTW2S_005430, partial [Raoultella planticola]